MSRQTGTFQRWTRQRRLIVEELRRLRTHPSATELHAVLRRRLPTISLGTVYRNLEILARSGEIQKIESPGVESRFDGNREPHYHVRCEQCGRVDDVHDLPASPVAGNFRSVEGYEILGVHVELRGICPACQEAAGHVSESKLDAGTA